MKVQPFAIFFKETSDPDVDNIIALPQGFSRWGAAFTLFWVLYHRMWMVSIMLLGCYLAFFQLAHFYGFSPSLPILGLVFFVGFNAALWRGNALEKRGYVFENTVYATDALLAKQRFLDITERDFS